MPRGDALFFIDSNYNPLLLLGEELMQFLTTSRSFQMDEVRVYFPGDAISSLQLKSIEENSYKCRNFFPAKISVQTVGFHCACETPV